MTARRIGSCRETPPHAIRGRDQPTHPGGALCEGRRFYEAYRGDGSSASTAGLVDLDTGEINDLECPPVPVTPAKFPMTATARTQTGRAAASRAVATTGSQAADHQRPSQGPGQLIIVGGGARCAPGLTSPGRSAPQVVAEVARGQQWLLGRHRRALVEPDHASRSS
jgi:hypothetical protein